MNETKRAQISVVVVFVQPLSKPALKIEFERRQALLSSAETIGRNAPAATLLSGLGAGDGPAAAALEPDPAGSALRPFFLSNPLFGSSAQGHRPRKRHRCRARLQRTDRPVYFDWLSNIACASFARGYRLETPRHRRCRHGRGGGRHADFAVFSDACCGGARRGRQTNPSPQ